MAIEEEYLGTELHMPNKSLMEMENSDEGRPQ
jgi:hypothetical protein